MRWLGGGGGGGGSAAAARRRQGAAIAAWCAAASMLFSALAVCAIHAQNDARCRHAAIRCHQALSLPPPPPPLKSVLKVRTSANIKEGLIIGQGDVHLD